MIIQILIAIVIFLQILFYTIIIDVILSWLAIIWLQIRPKFIADIIDPIYKKIKSVIPTSIWPLDFTPIVVIIFITFLQWFIYILFPEVQRELFDLLN